MLPNSSNWTVCVLAIYPLLNKGLSYPDLFIGLNKLRVKLNKSKICGIFNMKL